MNEQDFRDALHQTMAVSTAPPPMSDGEVLDAARRDQKRRRAVWAGGGSATAVAAVAVGVVVLAPPGSGEGVNVGGEVQSTQYPMPGTVHGDRWINTSWPNMPTGPATSVWPYDIPMALVTELAAAVPAGYESPDDLELKRHEAKYEDTVNGTELWSFTAAAPITQGTGTGKLVVEVATPRAESTGEGCALTAKLWGLEGDCTEVTVGGKKVAVVTPTDDAWIDQWAGFRHDDGTVVFVAQSAAYNGESLPPLAAPPLTADQLAALAVDPRFNLD